MSEKQIVFGLDFGTTNSALSYNSSGNVEVIDMDEYNPSGKTLRSVVYFDADSEVYVGSRAVDLYIENAGGGRFLQSIKSFLPSALFDYTMINGRRYGLEDIIAIMLKRMKKKGEEFVGREVTDVVMGRPVFFSSNEKEDRLAEERLRKAAGKAGFKNILFQYEPIAAAVTFESRLPEGTEKIVLIGDFGGGTSDFSVIRLVGGRAGQLDRKRDVLSLGGIYTAGDVLDSEVMWQKVAWHFGKDVKYKNAAGHVLKMPTGFTFKLRNWHLIPQLNTMRNREFLRSMKRTADNPRLVENLENLIEDNYGFMLFRAIEAAKIELSSQNLSRILFHDRGLEIEEPIDRDEYEDIIKSHIRKLETCIDDTVSRAGLSPEDIDVVFRTGGTSHLPIVKTIFEKRFGPEKLVHADAFTSVVHGLGILGSQFFHQSKRSGITKEGVGRNEDSM